MRRTPQIVRFTIFSLLVFCVVLSSVPAQQPQQDINKILDQLPPNVREMVVAQNTPKGQMTFPVLPSGGAFGGIEMTGAPIAIKAIDAAMRGGVVYAVQIESTDSCPKMPNFTMYVLFLGKQSTDSYLITNQQAQTATLVLNGTMRRWKPDADYCSSNRMREIESGPGGLSATFSTMQHMTPRNFLAIAGLKDEKPTSNRNEARKFFEENIIPYYKAIVDYRKRSGASANLFEDNNEPMFVNASLSSAQRRMRVPSGWMGVNYTAVRDGMIVDNISAARWSSQPDIGSLKSDGALRYGLQGLTREHLEGVWAHSTAIYNERQKRTKTAKKNIFRTVNSMIAMTSEVTKHYAEQKNDAGAAEAQRAAKVTVRDNRNVYDAVDSDLMAMMLLKAFETADETSEAPAGVTGHIWGPGLKDELLPNVSQPGTPVPIATSYAVSENQAGYSPQVLAALRRAGYRIPKMPKKDILDVKMPNGMKVDLREPIFYGQMRGAKILQRNAPKLHLSFSVKTEAKIFNHNIDGKTIFDDDVQDVQTGCEYYVGTNGNDGNPGTAQAPFATMQHALGKAQECKKSAEVILLDGTYRQSASVTWSNTPSTPQLTIRAANPGGAILSGTDVVNTQWQTALGGWQATLSLSASSPPVIVVNGQRLTYSTTRNLNTPGTFTMQGNRITVSPPQGVRDMNSATVEVGTRSYALRFAGARNVTISNLVFSYFPRTAGNQTPGLMRLGGSQINVQGCTFN